MTTQTNRGPDPQLDLFETRLLAGLRREVADSASRVPPRRRTRQLLTVSAGVAAAAVLGVILLPGLGTSAAYSVSEGNAGEIQVEINRPEDAAGLERALAEHGIAADVTYLPELQSCAPNRYIPVDRKVGLRLQIGEEQVKVTLLPGAIRDGETFVMVWSVEPLSDEELAEIEATEGGRIVSGSAASVSADVTDGPVAPCHVVPAAAN